jgi:hypothetical protein
MAVAVFAGRGRPEQKEATQAVCTTCRRGGRDSYAHWLVSEPGGLLDSSSCRSCGTAGRPSLSASAAGAHKLSLPLRDGWNMVTRERLLIAIGEQDERYGSERYGDQRSEGGAQIGFPIVGCLVVRHRDLRLPHFVANACTGSRFLRGWPRGATQPFGGRKRRLARAAVAFGYALPWLMMGVAQLVGLRVRRLPPEIFETRDFVPRHANQQPADANSGQRKRSVYQVDGIDHPASIDRSPFQKVNRRLPRLFSTAPSGAVDRVRICASGVRAHSLG